ncbi:MAG: hypothetical protein U9532_04070 ['Conium maculatum' witches'-broom phytoplasma]|nr:hypothetical protein ['Conium maculatum' witches'-broom phytoplasma]
MFSFGTTFVEHLKPSKIKLSRRKKQSLEVEKIANQRRQDFLIEADLENVEIAKKSIIGLIDMFEKEEQNNLSQIVQDPKGENKTKMLKYLELTPTETEQTCFKQ